MDISRSENTILALRLFQPDCVALSNNNVLRRSGKAASNSTPPPPLPGTSNVVTQSFLRVPPPSLECT